MRHALFVFTFILVTSAISLEAQTLKGVVNINSGSMNLTDFSVVTQDKNNTINSASVDSSGKFLLSGASTRDRLFLLHKSNFYSPLVLAIKRGKTVKSVAAALKGDFCSEGTAEVVVTSKGKLKGSLRIEIDGDRGVAYSKKVKKKDSRSLSKGASASAATNCLPTGLSEISGTSALRRSAVAVSATDPDGDGVANEEDSDDDNDGVADTFDPDNDGDGIIDDADSDNNDKNTTSQLFYFQQLHLNREDSFHPKLQSVTTAMIDSALVAHGGLALEVKPGSSVELNCGGDSDSGGEGLPWCSSGGTGRVREPFPDGVEFPEGSDSDNDGKGEITAGGSGDFQLAPGATSSQIRPGDTFIEEVTDSSDTVTKYVGVLNSVVLTVPGIVQITTGVATYTLDYPATSTSVGTYSNPVLIPSSGDGSITVTLYPPVYNTGAGQVVPGNLTVGLQIPNGPCTYDSMTQMCSGGGSGPGLLPGTLFSSPSTGWEVSNDGIKSNLSDSSVEDSQSVTFTVNLTGSGGVSGWDAGKYLMVPFQAFDNNGTTAAHNVIFRRQP